MKKERTLGKAQERRHYDLPLNKGAGAGFLILLIGLMTFLAVLALSASFALSGMTKRWSSGLENKVTVEIPVTGNMRREDVRNLTEQIAAMLGHHPAVAAAHALSDQEIAALVGPWLGSSNLNDLPLPGLISLDMKTVEPNTYRTLENRIREIAPQARLDTHEEWLGSLLRFTGALQLTAFLLTIIVGLTTAAAVAGAVRSRLAEHAEEVRLLHLMGAADRYISRQFQRHSLIMALQGGAGGIVAGGLMLLVIAKIAGGLAEGLLPGFHLALWQMAVLTGLPLLAGGIATLAAGKTVYRVLAQLP